MHAVSRSTVQGPAGVKIHSLSDNTYCLSALVPRLRARHCAGRFPPMIRVTELETGTQHSWDLNPGLQDPKPQLSTPTERVCEG